MKKFFDMCKQKLFNLFFLFAKKQIIATAKQIAMTGNGSDLCLKEGFLPVPIHFHSSIPDLDDLDRRKIWNVKSGLAGIDFRKDAQMELLREFGQKFGDECGWPKIPTANPLDFYTGNPGFGGGCAALAHSMIRHFKPDTVVEIGSGSSSLIIDAALRLNDSEGNTKSNYIIVDPYPRESIKNGLAGKRLIEERVELLDRTFFEQLRENDILFIDSGHAVRIGGDVNFLYLDVLPMLNPGVILHAHDVRLPYEYAECLAKNKTFPTFWTEQYLLQSFLCFNDQFEVLLGANYMMVEHGDEFLKAFPHCDLGDHPSSFWIRRKTAND